MLIKFIFLNKLASLCYILLQPQLMWLLDGFLYKIFRYIANHLQHPLLTNRSIAFHYHRYVTILLRSRQTLSWTMRNNFSLRNKMCIKNHELAYHRTDTLTNASYDQCWLPCWPWHFATSTSPDILTPSMHSSSFLISLNLVNTQSWLPPRLWQGCNSSLLGMPIVSRHSSVSTLRSWNTDIYE